MIKWLKVFFYLLPSLSMAQDVPLPIVSFNHLYVVLRNEDLKNIRQSSYVSDTLAALETRTTNAGNETWTGTYLYGTDNYLELFDTASMHDASPGMVGIGFSVDRLQELATLQSALASEYDVSPFDQVNELANDTFSWYHGLYIDDSVFYQQSALGFWIMAYDAACFSYYHLAYREDLLTPESYLERFQHERSGKLISRFTGAVLQLTPFELDYFSRYLLHIGFSQKGSNDFIASNKQFTFTLMQRAAGDSLVLTALLFETNFPASKKTLYISSNVSVTLNKMSGSLNFK